MNEKVQAVLERFKNGKLMLILGLAGILLIFVSSFVGKSEDAEPVLSNSFDTAAYIDELEAGVVEIVAGITGSKQVKAVITLDTDITYNYADETKLNKSNSESEKTVSTATDSEQKYIIITDSSGNETALLINREMPQIRGVVVVYSATETEEINAKITEALTAMLAVTSKRIYISGG